MNDEHDHWKKAVTDVVPLPREEKILPPSVVARRKSRAATPPPPPAPPEMPVPAVIERGLLARIGKESEPIEARLDLHGMTEAQAYQRFAAFIAEAYAHGLRTVLVITGKGRKGEGALRRAFKHWLEAKEIRGYINGYHTATRTHGGEGAWYVRIRRNTGRP